MKHGKEKDAAGLLKKYRSEESRHYKKHEKIEKEEAHEEAKHEKLEKADIKQAIKKAKTRVSKKTKKASKRSK